MATNETERVTKYEFSKGHRFCHWVRALCILALAITGYYLAYVFQMPATTDEPVNFMQAKWRFAHLVFGFVFIGIFFFKCYLFFWDTKSVNERLSSRDFFDLNLWINQIKFYLFLTNEHPKLRGIYNPLQFMAYVTMYLVFALFCVTGVALYVHVYHDGLGGALSGLGNWFSALCGGIANVRMIHHICMNFTMFFIMLHVYMVIFNTIKGLDGSMDAIISGYKFNRKGE